LCIIITEIIVIIKGICKLLIAGTQDERKSNEHNNEYDEVAAHMDSFLFPVIISMSSAKLIVNENTDTR
jgi:hypothetical protein